METAMGRVCSVGDGKITVVVDAPVACRRCASGNGCGAGLLAGPGKPKTIDVDVPPGMTPAVGDQVALTLGSVQLLRAASITYGLPLLAMVASAWLASWVAAGPNNLAAIGIVAAGLAAGFAASRKILGRDAACRQFIPVIDAPVTRDE